MDEVKLVKITERTDGVGLYVSWADGEVYMIPKIPENVDREPYIINPHCIEEKFGTETFADAMRVTQFFHFMLVSRNALTYVESLNMVSGELLKALKALESLKALNVETVGRNIIECVARRGWDLNDLIHSDAWPPLEPKDEKKELLPE